jgi:2-methylisocitrate lyase-like PEP mutase family enzyme
MKTADNSQLKKAQTLKALHERDGIFVIANPWDAGSAKLLASLGYEALATTSAGLAFGLGKPDGENDISREDALANAKAIVDVTGLPVSADLENGYGDAPEDCADTILLAAKAGLVGGSIEDATGNPDKPIYDFDLSVERVKAAVQAARTLPFPFTLTARAENLIRGKFDLKDTLKRLEAYADAGADVLFAPGLKTKEEIEAAVIAAGPKPLNVVLNVAICGLTLHELEDMGVKRVSLGSSLILSAYGAFMRSATEIKESGTFSFAVDNLKYADANALFRG